MRLAPTLVLLFALTLTIAAQTTAQSCQPWCEFPPDLPPPGFVASVLVGLGVAGLALVLAVRDRRPG